jgi:serine-type D-Ala-D-Ala carboxypeptidase/endopeptidase (penicillin-binding protein 4)|uniref:D-alanyl-D-alanine carboxypeptidase n=1 Tax=Candidatus Planktophila sp. TaxID=2175601 RepID=UPI004049076F
MKKVISVAISALFCGVFLGAPTSAFDPVWAAKVFNNLALDPDLRNPSVILIDASTKEVLFESNSSAARKPASTLKILAGVAVAKYLDPTMRFQTSLSIATKENAVVIQGDLDPWATFSAYNAKRLGQTSLKYLAYRGHAELEAQAGTPIKKMTIYYNGIYDSEATNMKVYLKSKKVVVNVKPVTAMEAQNLVSEPVMNSISPSVLQMTHYFMKWSNNVLSERMARLAAKSAGYSPNTDGIRAVFKKVLTDLEIDSSKLVVKDGSGLSHKNRLSAKLLGEVLLRVHEDPEYKLVVDSLPSGGINGTLNERFIKTAPQAIGLVRAKTGTLKGTVTLAGYVEAQDREYIFVVIADRLSRSYTASKVARNTLDRYLGKIALPLLPIVPVQEISTPVQETSTVETLTAP